MNEVVRSLRAEPLRRFKPYPAYKDSGVEWLGEIPAHWEVAPVYARYDVALGKMLDTKRVTGEFSGRYLRNVDVQWDRVNTEGLPEMDFAPSERDRYLLRPGDLLVCEGGEVGRTAIWKEDLAECFYQKAIHRLRVRGDSEEPRFFYFMMCTMAQRGVFTAGGNPNTIDHLTAVQLRHYRMPFPRKPEQRAIAAFLDGETARIDALVAKKERLIELLQEKRSTLITRAVTKGLDPTVLMKDSGVEWLGEIPAHWEVKRIAMAAVKITNGYVGPTRDILVNEGVRYLQSLHIKAGAIDFDRRPYYVTPEWSRQHAKSVLASGDVLVVQTGDIGQVAVVPSEFEGCNCHALIIIRLRRNVGTGEWLATSLQSNYGRHSLLWSQTGALHPHLECGHVREIRIAFPPPMEQMSILRCLDDDITGIDNLTAKVCDAIDRLKELRTALISAAVTGKIDVREEVA